MRPSIKSCLSSYETEILRDEVRGLSVIEIGALLGYSTINIAQVARNVTSIDPHAGYPYYRPCSTLREYLHNLESHGVSRKVKTIVARAQNVLGKLPSAEATFIDCTGLYEDTKFCLDNASGKIICHDFGRSDCPGVEKAVLEFVKKTKRDLQVVDTLAIVR